MLPIPELDFSPLPRRDGGALPLAAAALRNAAERNCPFAPIRVRIGKP